MTTTTREVTSTDDMIDVRDIIARVEELEAEITGELDGEAQLDDEGNVKEDIAKCGVCGFEWNDALISGITPTPSGRCPVEYEHAEREELATLTDLLDELRGCGGDEQWQGHWYPVTLINSDYFEDYARQLADDIGAINAEATWPNNHINWEAAAEDLKQDYSTVDFGESTYYYR